MNQINTPYYPSDITYYQNVRSELANYIEKGDHRILDVGCGAGYFGEFLKLNGHASDLIGIEIDTVAAHDASTRLDYVLCANLNETTIVEVLKDYERQYFDYIVCADVLEHLIDPWEALSQLVTFLKPNGRIILSLPNVRHWSIWIPLILRGHWEYRDAGIMDRTHLRFFTRRSGVALLNGAGLTSTYNTLLGGKWRDFDKYTLRLLTEFISIQLVFVGIKGE
jgi:2-polyprenyl-3-methyl-5-hydroxy-6-metoxy-1,4-benzoquinol methylase